MTIFTTTGLGARQSSMCALGLALLIALAGCGQRSSLNERTATAVTVASELPVPETADLYTATRELRFGPGDTLTVSVLGAPELGSDHTVDGRGVITLPLIGEISALGRTPAEVARVIEEGLGRRFLRDPQVTVNPKAVVSQNVTLLGSVTQPGRYAINGSTTLRDAIAQARGINDVGSERDIVVFRTVNNQKLAARFDLQAINGGRMVDPPLYPNDQIYVGINRNRQLLRDLAPLVPLSGIFFQIL